MNTTKRNLLLANVALAAVIGLAAGCASKGYEQGAATGQALQTTAARINQGNASIDAAVNSLNALVNNPTGDLVPRYKAYGDAVTNLRDLATDVKSKAEAMQSKGKEFFAAWDKQLAQIKNEDIREQSADRKKAVQKEFSDINASFQKAKDKFKPFMSNLEDINTYLGSDLTVGGIQSIKKTADKVADQAAGVKDSIDELSKEFKEMGVSMSNAGPAPQQQQK
jgi:methyl-accepting chemotaxis protein